MNNLTSSEKSSASLSGGKDLPVSVGVQAPAEIPRSGDEIMTSSVSGLRISALTIIQ